MRRIAENGAVVFFKLSFKFSDKSKIWEFARLYVQKLSRMFNPSVFINDMMRKLKRNIFIRSHFRMIWKCRTGRLKVNHVEWINPRLHFFSQCVFQNIRFSTVLIYAVNLKPFAFIVRQRIAITFFSWIDFFGDVADKIKSFFYPFIFGVLTGQATSIQFFYRRLFKISVGKIRHFSPAFFIAALFPGCFSFIAQCKRTFETF